MEILMKVIIRLGILKFLAIAVVCLFLSKCVELSNGRYQGNERQEQKVSGGENYTSVKDEDEMVQIQEKQNKSHKDDKTQVGKYVFLQNKWRFTLQYGFLQSRMNEYVDGNDRLISQLIWRNTLVSILTAGIAYRPADNFEIELKGSITPKKSSNGRWRMDDYDWLNNFSDAFTDHSHHKEGDFRYIHLDLTMKLRLFELGQIDRTGIFSMHALFGISYTELKSLQDGMSYCWYYSGAYVWEGNSENGLLYRQRLITPYFGLSAMYQYKHFSILMEFKYSFLNFVKTLDIHYYRDYYTYDNYHNVPVYELRINTGYWITNHIRAFFEASFAETKTKSVYSISITQPDDYKDGYLVYHGQSGESMNNWRYIFSLGINVGF